MWLIAVSTVTAVALGVTLAILGGTRSGVLVPIRSFAAAAVITALALHTLPEAIADVGPLAVMLFLGGLALPGVLSRVGARLRPGVPHQHGRLAVELGFVSILIHQVSDGLVLGAATGSTHAGHAHWDLIIGVAAHTVPLVAVAVMVDSTLETGARLRAMAWRGALIVLCTLAGVVIARFGQLEADSRVSAWVNAIVPGILLHVLSHDAPRGARPIALRTVELVAVAIGIALPVLLGHSHGDAEAGVHVTVTRALVVALAQPMALVGVIAVALGWGLTRHLPAVMAGYGWLIAPVLVVALMMGANAAAAVLGTGVLGVLVTRPWARLRTAPSAATEPDASSPGAWLRTVDEIIVHTWPRLVAATLAAVVLLVALAGRDGLTGTHALDVGALAVLVIGGGRSVLAVVPVVVAIGFGVAARDVLQALCIGIAWCALRGGWRVGHGPGPVVRVGTAIAVAGVGFVAASLAARTVSPAGPWLHDGVVGWLTLVLAGVMVVRGLWRFGLDAFLEPLAGVGEGHASHHQHPEDAPCEQGCHDHDAVPAPAHAHDHHRH